MSGEVRAAVITAVVGAVGVLAGGGIAYLTNESTLKQQLRREEQQQQLAARGDARVYQETLYDANQILREVRKNNRWPRRAELSYFALPSLEDRRLVQSRASSNTYKRVLLADQAVLAVASIIQVEPGNRLTAGKGALIRGWQRDLEGAAADIREISR